MLYVQQRNFRTLSFVLLFLASPISASEGMLGMMIYYCNPAKLTARTVAVCNVKFPTLAKEGEMALAMWQQRNGAVAKIAAEQCQQEWKDFRANLQTEAERITLDTGLQKLEADWVEDFITKDIARHGVCRCEKLFKDLKNTTTDIAPLLQKAR